MGFVYVLLNPDSPHQVKVGMTHGDADKRAKQLHTTGVARGFVVLWAQGTADPEGLEKAMHHELAEFRVNSKREFFRVTPQRAIEALLRLADDAGIPLMHSATDRDITEQVRGQWGHLVDSKLVFVHLTHSPRGTVLTERRGSGTNQTIAKSDLDIICDDDEPMFRDAASVDEAARLFSGLDLNTVMATTGLIAPDVIEAFSDAQTAGVAPEEIEPLIVDMLAAGQDRDEILAAIAAVSGQAADGQHRDTLSA